MTERAQQETPANEALEELIPDEEVLGSDGDDEEGDDENDGDEDFEEEDSDEDDDGDDEGDDEPAF